jgi:hypothetical protein
MTLTLNIKVQGCPADKEARVRKFENDIPVVDVRLRGTDETTVSIWDKQYIEVDEVSRDET